ncbi:uncharacterized protein LOC124966053 [Sciurus carolinensis]|uniref:uncharacterized protein LOC124966053 n=1 Tax=Sciurus carolinensis TaxID=30640 RepID=UPI001FB3E3DE|nr:uncharacterized protein LOC124966053 [Sciurus carolinensis]
MKNDTVNTGLQTVLPRPCCSSASPQERNASPTLVPFYGLAFIQQPRSWCRAAEVPPRTLTLGEELDFLVKLSESCGSAYCGQETRKGSDKLELALLSHAWDGALDGGHGPPGTPGGTSFLKNPSPKPSASKKEESEGPSWALRSLWGNQGGRGQQQKQPTSTHHGNQEEPDQGPSRDRLDNMAVKTDRQTETQRADGNQVSKARRAKTGKGSLQSQVPPWKRQEPHRIHRVVARRLEKTSEVKRKRIQNRTPTTREDDRRGRQRAPHAPTQGEPERRTEQRTEINTQKASRKRW